MCARVSLSYLAASDNHVTELYYLTCLYDIAWAVADRKFDKQNETPEPLSVRLCMDNRCPKTQTQWQPTPLQAICCVLAAKLVNSCRGAGGRDADSND